jgi:hypothetical protein
MSTRYEQVTDGVYSTLKEVREDHFPELAGAEILCVFDTKKKMTKGKLELASIVTTNDLQKFLTLEETGTEEGFDYIMRIDKKAWDSATQADRVRLIRHELRHTMVDPDNAKPWKTRGHSIEDFYSEIRMNEDNPRWAQELVGRTLMKYEEDAGE